MKYKPPKRKRHVARPIVDLIPHSKHILLTLLEKNNNVNAIFRNLEQTGFNYKRDVLDSIEYLEKAKLIIKRAMEGSIKIEVSLTDIGSTVAKLIVNIEKYLKARSHLQKAVTEKFDLPYLKQGVTRYTRDTTIEPEQLVPILQNAGWNAQEINRFGYDNCVPPKGIDDLLYGSPMVIINLVLHKYVLLSQLVQNEIGRSIIQKIIIDLITELLQLLKFQRNANEESESEQILEHISTAALYYNIGVISFGAFMYRFMNDQVTEVLDSIFSIAETRKDHIEKRLNDVIQFERKKTKDIHEEAKKHPERWDDDEIYLQDSILKAEPFFQNIIKKLS
jgi:hypothetical protein